MWENKNAGRMRFSAAKKVFSGLAVFSLLLCLSEFVFPVRLSVISIKKKDPSKILKEIYLEVKGFEKYPGYDFIKREFFVGEDDDDTNKDIHVVILVQDVDEKKKVTIQITYMERSKGRPVIGIAKYTKVLSYFVLEDQTEIIKSDFNDKGKELVLPGVLQAIKNKKKLLKEI
jgi:hypothetical protein